MEYLDIRNRDGSITGQIKERSLVHTDGDLHGTVHIFIIRRSTEGYEVLLQKRSQDKDAYPGCYDISSAGHVSAGQTYIEAALRELEEELGISATESQLHFLGYHEGQDQHIFHGKIFRNHELAAVYLYEEAVDETSLILQEEEVDSVRWFTLQECKEKAEVQDPDYCLFLTELEMIEAALTHQA